MLIVDAAQSAGVLPVNITKMGIDILCASGHKGLYGPSGTGLMILGSDKIKLNTLIEGGTGSNSFEITQPCFPPDRYESGTINTSGLIALGAGIDFVSGRNDIYEHELKLCRYAYKELSCINGVITYGGNYVQGKKTPVLPFNIEGLDSTEAEEHYNQAGILMRSGLHCAPLAHQFLGTIDSGTIRMSPSVFNKAIEVEKFIEATKVIVRKNRVKS